MRKLLSMTKQKWTRQTAGIRAAAFKTKKRKYIAAAGISLLVIAAVFVFGRGSAADKSFKVTARDYSETVVASGVLRLEEETDLVAEVSGSVESLSAQDGDVVSGGAILISVESQDNPLDLGAAQAVYENAQARYDQLVSVDYPAAESALSYQNSLKEQAAKEYRDAQILYSEGAISQNDLNLKQIQLDSTHSQWSAAALRLSSLGEGGAQRLSALADLDAAQAQYEKAEARAGKYDIAVPWDAVLLQSYVSPSDRVEPGQVLARIGKKGGYYVNTELDEKYFPYISKEKEVRISVGDGRMGEMRGWIVRITPAINTGTGTFEVRIAIPENFPYQASGLSVNIDIVLLQVSDALIVPAAYIASEAGKDYVLLQNGASAERKEVEVLRGAGSDVVVVDGLEEGRTILLPGDKNDDAAAS